MSEEEFEVESILDDKIDKSGHQQFLVKWANYDSDDNTWESLENLADAEELLEAYLQSKKAKKPTKSTRRQSSETINTKTKKRKAHHHSDSDDDGKENSIEVVGADGLTRKAVILEDGGGTPETVMVVISENYPAKESDWDDVLKVAGMFGNRDNDNDLIAIVEWKNGNFSMNKARELRYKCPSILFDFYENHIIYKEKVKP